MLLRRVIEHVTDQNWTAIGIDFAIVVIGVFVGLQVTSWNEDRIAASRAQIYYQRLTDDLQAELDSREARVSYFERTRSHAEAALRAMQPPEEPLGAAFLVDAYQASQRWSYAPQRATYDELTAAGIADAIPDVDIRARLANLYVNLEASNVTLLEPTPYRDEVRRHMPHDVQSSIRESCNDRYRFLDNGLVYLELPVKCKAVIEDSRVAEAIRALSAYRDMEMDLARHIAILDTKLSSLRAYMLPIQEMIEVLATGSD